jgi:hypothetical protein
MQDCLRQLTPKMILLFGNGFAAHHDCVTHVFVSSRNQISVSYEPNRALGAQLSWVPRPGTSIRRRNDGSTRLERIGLRSRIIVSHSFGNESTHYTK